MTRTRSIRIATRGSALALWQATHVAEVLRGVGGGREIELVHVTTAGDQDRLQPLAQIGGAGLFTRGVQQAVLENNADVAVHSLKDLPTEATDGLTLAAVPERASPHDVLVLPDPVPPECTLCSLASGARVGTGSLRRRAQLLYQRRDLRMLDVRGNVETRIARLDAGEYDALVLAEAGLRRLGLDDRISLMLSPPIVYPAVGQGALGLECRTDDAELLSLLRQIGHPPTQQAVLAERSLLAELRTGCHAPLGVWTEHTPDGALRLEAVVLDPDGRERIQASASDSPESPRELGRQAADELRHKGADKLLAAA